MPVISNNHDLYERQILTCKPVLLKKDCWKEDLAMIDAYVQKGDLIMHHSEAFSETYNPHYRIIARDIFEKEIKPLIERIRIN